MEDAFLKSNDVIELTQQALLLEDLISKFAVGSTSSSAENQNHKENKPLIKGE